MDHDATFDENFMAGTGHVTELIEIDDDPIYAASDN